MTDIRGEYLSDAEGDDEVAAVNFAHDLTKGEPATFKQGYSVENAAIAASEMFFVDKSLVEKAVEYRLTNLQVQESMEDDSQQSDG